MDIAKMSMNMAQVKLAQSVQISMLKKTMEQMEQTGEQLLKMIQTTPEPKKGSIDIRA